MRLDWQSYDPFDLLLSPYARRVQSISWLAARVIVQIGKRSGSGLRRALRVPEHEEAKALADYLRAAVMLSVGGQDWAQSYVGDLSTRLQARSTETAHGRGWGLDFPYASRFISVGKGTPNIYTTTSACQAFLDQYALTRDPSALETAVEGSGFILDGLGTFQRNGNQWLRYWRGVDTPTINVQASAASLLARIGHYSGDARAQETADRAAQTVLAMQQSDGSWPYADDGRATFVDGFHTGFTLQGMAEYASWRGEHVVPETTEALRRGLEYFKEHLLTSDGLPRGFADGKVSLDGQNLAQCIQTLVVCGGEASDRRAATHIWQLGLEDLLDGQLSRKKSFPALRWSIGPAVLATAYLLREPARATS